MTPFLALVFGTMAVEAAVSRRHERTLRAMGAVEPPDDVYPVMRWAYPLCFALIAAEAIARGVQPVRWPGAAIFAAAKLLKWWAIATLGTRWTFRVLVLPDVPLIANGPYRYLRHPNYLAVAGEIVGAAVALGAPFAGIVGGSGFAALMRRRIITEERMLKLR